MERGKNTSPFIYLWVKVLRVTSLFSCPQFHSFGHGLSSGPFWGEHFLGAICVGLICKYNPFSSKDQSSSTFLELSCISIEETSFSSGTCLCHGITEHAANSDELNKEREKEREEKFLTPSKSVTTVIMYTRSMIIIKLERTNLAYECLA